MAGQFKFHRQHQSFHLNLICDPMDIALNYSCSMEKTHHSSGTYDSVQTSFPWSPSQTIRRIATDPCDLSRTPFLNIRSHLYSNFAEQPVLFHDMTQISKQMARITNSQFIEPNVECLKACRFIDTNKKIVVHASTFIIRVLFFDKHVLWKLEIVLVLLFV